MTEKQVKRQIIKLKDELKRKQNQLSIIEDQIVRLELEAVRYDERKYNDLLQRKKDVYRDLELIGEELRAAIEKLSEG